GDVDKAWLELNEKWPHIFRDDITNHADQLKRIAEVAEGLKYKNIPIAETMDDGTKAALREEFEAHMEKLEDSMYQIGKFSNAMAEKQIRKLMMEGVPIDYSQLTTADVKWLYDERWRLDKEAQRLRKTRNLTDGDKDTLNRLLKGEIDEARARKNAGINANDLMDIYRAELPLSKTKKAIAEYKKYSRSHVFQNLENILGDIKIKDIDGEGWKDSFGLLLGRETPERVIDMVAPKETAAKIKKYIFEGLHENERKRTIFINDVKGKVRDIRVSTKKDMVIKLWDGREIPISESGLVQWLGEKEYELKRLLSMKKAPTKQEYDQMNTLQKEIDAALKLITPKQEERIRKAIAQIQQIYKDDFFEPLNEKLILMGHEPIGYIEGYFPHMHFDDPADPIHEFAAKFGFDTTSTELPIDIAGITENFRPTKKWSGNMLERKGTETDYDALRALDMYTENVSDIMYHTEDIIKLRTMEDYMRYNLSSDAVKARVDEIRNNPELNEVERTEKIQAEYDKVKNPTLQN
ncbi:MAG: hypothetical protein IKW21_02165, partial [Lachnospiraceae bacterium]|nr:hypothetical protein [Lachnospiraceae bacterium]